MTARKARLSPSAVALAASFAELREELQVPAEYPADAEAEALRVIASGRAVDGSDGTRRDLEDIPFFTIDPEGSRDLDQAMHLARDGDGYVVHYAIADLAAFVAPGGALDRVTRERGQTLYAPDGSVGASAVKGPGMTAASCKSFIAYASTPAATMMRKPLVQLKKRDRFRRTAPRARNQPMQAATSKPRSAPVSE